MMKSTRDRFFQGSRALSRREFVAAAGAAGLAAPLFAQPPPVPADRKVRIAITGCGGRGGFIANLMAKHGGYEFVGFHDYFQDRVDGLAAKHGVPPERRFTGLDGYKRLLDLKPEALAVMSPPYFHPGQAADAVDAGCHVYVAKPVAVDVPGCRTIEASGRKATASGRVFLVDFQTRVNPFYLEAVKRVHGGVIGAFAFGEASYQCGRLGSHHLHPDAGTQESRLRNWVFDKALSGDIITEQNIHALDVMSWVFGKPPLRAYGTGARKVRVDIGDCRDTFSVVFQYPDDVAVTFNSRQFDGHGSADGILCRVFGEKGVLETAYGGNVMIRGGEGVFYRGGETKQIYAEGAAANVAAFHAAVLTGDVANATVAPSVQSNLVTILGRTAADTGRAVTWDEVAKDTAAVDPRLQGLKG
jgi:predicted dehydrogenase